MADKNKVLDEDKLGVSEIKRRKSENRESIIFKNSFNSENQKGTSVS